MGPYISFSSYRPMTQLVVKNVIPEEILKLRKTSLLPDLNVHWYCVILVQLFLS